MFTKEEQDKLKKLISSNDDFAYFINKSIDDCKLLTSQITHELRNPLTLIKSTAQLIESEHPEIRDYKYWTQLTGDIDGLVDLLAQLSLFNNSQIINKKEHNILLLIKSILDSFRPHAEQNNINLSFTIAEEYVPYFLSYPLDQIKFKQLMTNLIRNAFEAIQEGNYINVECKAFPESHLIIAIHDNGKMIPEDELSTIFQPFITYKPGGSGLGLAISSNIVAAHGGTISVTSSEEKTSFMIQLPVLNTN
jgi:signal transduction histidine kinase